MTDGEPHVEPGTADTVETGSRLAVSPMTGAVYEVTEWIEGPKDGQMRARQKRELSDAEIEELPTDVREWIAEEREEVAHDD